MNQQNSSPTDQAGAFLEDCDYTSIPEYLFVAFWEELTKLMRDKGIDENTLATSLANDMLPGENLRPDKRMESQRKNVKNWLEEKCVPEDRHVIFRLCFALNLSQGEAARLLKICDQPAIHFRRLSDLVYDFYLRNGFPFHHARTLIEDYDAKITAPNNLPIIAGSHISQTQLVKDKYLNFLRLPSEDQYKQQSFLDLLDQNLRYFGIFRAGIAKTLKACLQSPRATLFPLHENSLDDRPGVYFETPVSCSKVFHNTLKSLAGAFRFYVAHFQDESNETLLSWITDAIKEYSEASDEAIKTIACSITAHYQQNEDPMPVIEELQSVIYETSFDGMVIINNSKLAEAIASVLNPQLDEQIDDFEVLQNAWLVRARNENNHTRKLTVNSLKTYIGEYFRPDKPKEIPRDIFLIGVILAGYGQTVDDMNEVLLANDLEPLYSRNRQDAKIISALNACYPDDPQHCAYIKLIEFEKEDLLNR